MIKIEDLSFGYPDKSNLINSFNFVASGGEIICVKGESGSGKTTLLNLICGVIPKMINGDKKGDIYINEKNISELSLPQVSEYVSLMMQDPDVQLFFPTVEQEIAFGPENLKIDPKIILSRIKFVLDILDIKKLRFKKTANLSFGEKKLVALAALVALDPKVFLLDEPFAGISNKHIKNIINLIHHLSEKGKIIFITDHLNNVIKTPDQFIEMEKLHNRDIDEENSI